MVGFVTRDLNKAFGFLAVVSGFVSNSFYKQIAGDKWAWNLVLTASLFSVPFFLIWSVINSVAWYYQSTQALPFTTIILLMLIWILGKCFQFSFLYIMFYVYSVFKDICML